MAENGLTFFGMSRSTFNSDFRPQAQLFASSGFN
jgi:hypothetical protein